MSTVRHSLRKAIDAKCRECIHDDRSGAGSWRQQVAACTSKNCPLYSVRAKPGVSTSGRRIKLVSSEIDRNGPSIDVLVVGGGA